MPSVLRPGLLDGIALTLSAPGPPSAFGAAIAARAAALGAEISALVVPPDGDEAEPPPRADVLVHDAGTPADARAALDAAWLAVRPAVAGHMAGRGGKIVLVAPPPGDAQAAGARAGLENLARTTSIEWARLQIRPTAVLPGTGTTPDEVAELVAYVASHAGDYYSGCAFTLGAA